MRYYRVKTNFPLTTQGNLNDLLRDTTTHKELRVSAADEYAIK
jgi:hypothetical protein